MFGKVIYLKTIITTDSGMDPIDKKNMVSGILIRNDNEEFKDVCDINSKEVLRQIDKGYTFKTSAPSLADYYQLFERSLNVADDVIHLSMSEGISSASVASANFVANDIDSERITVIDSKCGATGGTLINLYANYLVKKGLEKKEILQELKKFISHVKTSFFVPNPEGFQRSGRDKSELCLKEKALIVGGKVLTLAGVKFQVDFNDEGNLFVKKTMLGLAHTKVMQMIKEIVNDKTIADFEQDIAVIGTVLEERVNMQEVKEYLGGYFNNVIRQDINAVVAAYGSADLVGLSLVRKLK